MRRLTGRALILGLFFALLVAPTALAATVKRTGNTIQFDAAAGEVNQLKVSYEAMAAEFPGQPGLVFDDAVPVTPDPSVPPCLARGDDAVCPASNATSVIINLGDKDDRLDVLAGYPSTLALTANGGVGNDILNGGPAVDTLNGEAGSDTLNGGALGDTLSGGTQDDTLTGAATPRTTSSSAARRTTASTAGPGPTTCRVASAPTR
jgi:Ca2+-binding RTX toxin-like protein